MKFIQKYCFQKIISGSLWQYFFFFLGGGGRMYVSISWRRGCLEGAWGSISLGGISRSEKMSIRPCVWNLERGPYLYGIYMCLYQVWISGLLMYCNLERIKYGTSEEYIWRKLSAVFQLDISVVFYTVDYFSGRYLHTRIWLFCSQAGIWRTYRAVFQWELSL